MANPIRIVIVGGGFGGIQTLKNLHQILHGDQRVEISLINEQNYFLFTPLLHEVATGGINPENIIEPIRNILGCCVDSFYLGKAESINLINQNVKIGNRELPYDYLVLAPGAETNFYGITGVREHCFTLKSLEDAIKIKNHCIDRLERVSCIEDREKRKNLLRFVVVGGGATGVELAAELQEFLKETFSGYYAPEIIEDVSVILVERGGELLAPFGKKTREKSLKFLEKKGVKVMLNTKVKEVTASEITFDSGETLFSESIIWVAGIKPADLRFDQPVLKDSAGRIIVDEYLQLVNHKGVFALGDIASFKQKDAVLPALAQVATKESKTVANNIKLLINEKNLQAFSYKHSGYLLSLGRWMAVGEIKNFNFSGRFTWWIWRTVYLSKLPSFRKKIEVVFDWTMNIFSPRDISKI